MPAGRSFGEGQGDHRTRIFAGSEPADQPLPAGLNFGEGQGGQPVNPSYTAQGLQVLGSPTGQRAASIAATPEALPAGAALALAIQRLLGGARNQ
jgi:hypothetical protein